MVERIDNIRLYQPGDPPPELDIDLAEPDETIFVDPTTGAQTIELDDGSAIINLNPHNPRDVDEDDFYANLAEKMDAGELAFISAELMEGIDTDEESRAQWLATRARGIDLLGLKLEQPRSGPGDGPLEGMSVVRHPLLLEAVLRFQANARGELLPADGPVKVRDDDDMGGSVERDQLAAALQTDLNHYLTVDAPEYYPDTDRLLFYVGFGGCGFKKLYNCPIRRRPVSESVDAKDLIVSDAITDLRNAGRITHRIMMRMATLRRMQLAGAYRKVELYDQQQPELNVVDQKIADIQGISQDTRRQEDREREICEVYCELDIKGYEHKENGEITGLPLPYKVSIDRDSGEILEIRRNWEEDDDQCLPIQVFVKFPYVTAMGFYDIGLVHILGNAAMALTAAWREMLDAGMFANFPGGLIARAFSRQESNEFRIAPGSFMQVDTGGGSIQEAVMPLPYKDVSAGLLKLTESIQQIAERVGGTAEMNVGEGTQEAPVGTTLALIEQATKVEGSVHKRLHAAQTEEFLLLKRLFRLDPEALWRTNKKSQVKRLYGITTPDDPQYQAKLDRFITALNDHELIPASDPNTASEMHRLMKAMALIQLMQASQEIPGAQLDARRVMAYVLNVIKAGQDLLLPPDAAGEAPPDPKVIAAQLQAETSKDKITIAQMQSQDKLREIQSKEKVATIELLRDLSVNEANIESAELDQMREILKSATARQQAQLKEQADARKGQMDQVKFQIDQQKAHLDMAKTEREFDLAEREDARAEREDKRKDREVERKAKADDQKLAHDRKKLTLDEKKMDLAARKARQQANKPKPKAKK